MVQVAPVHAQTALFGVYGLLSLGQVLVIARLLTRQRVWDERWLARSFWAMNIGLALMVGLSLLPIGVLQAYASIDTGLWYARSADFLQQPLIQQLRWLRLVGDSVFLFRRRRVRLVHDRPVVRLELRAAECRDRDRAGNHAAGGTVVP